MKQFFSLTLRLVLLFTFISYLSFSQSITEKLPENGTVFFSAVNPQQFSSQQPSEILKASLQLSPNDELVFLENKSEQGSLSLNKFQQYHKGIKVEHGIYKVHFKNGSTNAISGEYYKVPASLNLKPSLSKAQALQKALAYVGAKTYKWQVATEEAWIKEQQHNPKATYYPDGELVICKNYLKGKEMAENEPLTLAYKFDIFAHEPVSRAYIYIDAHTGAVILQDAIIKHVDGLAHTRFSGQRTISTSLTSTYQLRDLSRGLGVETYNMRRGTSYGSAVDFTDNDNQWTTTEFDNSNKDNAALDCHWGAIKTYDYFRNIHGRNSFDGNGAKIRCYVHYGNNYVNAFWDGSVMTFGDGEMTGSTGIQPLTTLDITGHEIGHAVCQYTANLVYSYESGAMNEGFSDIWGAMIEYYADPTKSTWTIGEDANFIIRSMSNPNDHQHPDTYKGQYWYTGGGDNGGVHYNSGVLNHWFYLLCVGKSGVNDNGDVYNVTGIGISKAARITYRLESAYLTSNSQYKDARTFSILAATDLFGVNSQEAIQTANAWNAVGVYETAASPSNLLARSVSATQINLSWTDNATNETGFQLERSTNASSGFVLIASLPANTTSYANTGLPTDAIYYYRVRSLLGTTASSYSNTASAAIGNAPIVMSNGSFTTCNALFLDPGATGNYSDGQNLTMTLTPADPAKKLQIAFSSFSTESCCDYLSIYDGSSTAAPLIGTYYGYALPPLIMATNLSGQLTFRFYADHSVTGAGWQANISCVSPAAPTVVSLSPARHTRNAAAYSNIAVNFSQLMQASTASAGTIKIHGSLTGLLTQPAGGYFSGAGTSTAGFDPALNLKAGEVVSLTVTTNARSQAGMALPTAQVYQFTTAAAPAYAHFTVASSLPLPASPFGIAAADFDRDGDIDIASSQFVTAGTLAIRFNNGAGSFSPAGTVAVGANPRAIAAADFDNDGDIDLAVANQVSHTVSIRFNNGAGSFTGSMQVAVGTTPLGITAADFDGDGDMDLATANYGANTVSIRLNNGTGTFTGATELAVGVNPSWLQAADLDADGDMDLATTNYGANTVSIRLNNGTGTFTGSTQLAVGVNPTGLALADLDGDKDMDLATANSGAGTVSIRLNNGTGSFTGATELSLAAGTWSVVAADLDGDADLDLAAANATANTVTVRLNNGAGSFSGTGAVSVGTTPRILTAADFDNDGDIDLASANFAANSNSLLLNVAVAQNTNIIENSNTLMNTGDEYVEGFEVYPNPFKDELKLFVKSEHKQALLVTIVDAHGKVVYNANNYYTNREITITNQLSSGIYMLIARFGTKVKIVKIVKSK